MKIYLAGPMTGYPSFNYPLFRKASLLLRDEGYEVIDPTELDHPTTQEAAWHSATGDPTELPETMGTVLGRDVTRLLDDADGIALLPGWYQSKGARLEAVAAILNGKKLFDVRFPMETAQLVQRKPSFTWDELSHYTVRMEAA